MSSVGRNKRTKAEIVFEIDLKQNKKYCSLNQGT
jgi:hypothetical protein